MGARSWGNSGLGRSVAPPTAIEKLIGSGWLLSNNFGWVISEERGRVMLLDLSSSEGQRFFVTHHTELESCPGEWWRTEIQLRPEGTEKGFEFFSCVGWG